MQESLTEPKTHYRALDGYRAIALLLVVTHHYLGKIGADVAPVPMYGWIGVDLFFVLSGFLITGILFDSRRAGGTLKTFYMRRILRIFPLYYAVILFLLVVGLTSHTPWVWQQALWPVHLGNYARFLGSPPLDIARTDILLRRQHTVMLYGHFWSLCLEEQFYLLWPLVVFKLRDRRRLIQLCMAVIVLSPLARILAGAFAPQWMVARGVVYGALPFRADSLLIGGLLALLLRGPERAWLTRWRVPLGIAGICGLSSVFLCQMALGHAPAPPGIVGDPWYLTGFGYTLLDFGAAAVIAFLLDGESHVARLLHVAPLRNLGIVSYGCYVFHDLFHISFLDFAGRHGGTHMFLWAYVLGLIVMVLLATLSYHFYEKPFLRLKSRYKDAVHLVPTT